MIEAAKAAFNLQQNGLSNLCALKNRYVSTQRQNFETILTS